MSETTTRRRDRSATTDLPADTDAATLRARTAAAGAAAADWSATPDEDRAQALRAIADALDGAVDELAELADGEAHLGLPRLTGEVARTSGQLRMFADMIERGVHLDPVISPGDPGAGRPDVRRMQVALGPVAVFAASNFPFAFSVVGGDTASALAAGCPVIVKAHEGHPCTSARTAELVTGALREAGAPEGTFQIVYGQAAGGELVLAPEIRAVGFTGSLAGAQALMGMMAERSMPIPFYGELGSVNPVVVLPGAAAERTTEIAAGYAGSLTLGCGQFCTNPGLVFAPSDSPLLGAIGEAIADTRGVQMLTEKIRAGFAARVEEPAWTALDELGSGSAPEGAPVPEVRTVSLEAFAAELDTLTEERFGPAGLVVTYGALDALDPVLSRLPGSLTGSVHAASSEHTDAARLAERLRPRVGRLIFNGWPTGVAVNWAMMHGGPWPASSAPWSTSVGGRAIERFLVPVAYQDFPDELLPPALRADNPLGIARTVQPG